VKHTVKHFLTSKEIKVEREEIHVLPTQRLSRHSGQCTHSYWRRRGSIPGEFKCYSDERRGTCLWSMSDIKDGL
jgi:hypothetical protein